MAVSSISAEIPGPVVPELIFFAGKTPPNKKSWPERFSSLIFLRASLWIFRERPLSARTVSRDLPGELVSEWVFWELISGTECGFEYMKNELFPLKKKFL